MGERDAFGREIGEDTLKDMGWSGSRPGGAWEPPPVEPGDPLAATSTFAAGEATAPFTLPRRRGAEPEPERAEVEPIPPPAPPRSRRRRGPRPMTVARLIIAVAILGVGAIGVSVAVNLGKDAVSGIKDKIDTITEPPPPTAASPESLLRPVPLERALAKVPDGKLVNLRVAVDRVNAQVIAGKNRHAVQVDAAGKVSDVASPASSTGEPRLKVNAQAPMRMARTAAQRAHLKVGDVDYLVLAKDGWLLYFKDGGPHYRANRAGRAVKKF